MSSNNGVWDGKLSNLKISPHAYPELYKELSGMYHKERSDRLRVLALIGLLTLRGSFQPITTELSTGSSEAVTIGLKPEYDEGARKKSELTAKVANWGATTMTEI